MYICEIYVPRGPSSPVVGPGYWMPADGAEWGTRDQAVKIAAEWEAEGYTARITKGEPA